MTFQHVPVLLQETLSGLNIQPEGIYVDGTVGGAGHACEIAKQLHGAGRLIGLDRDPDAVAVATQRLAPYPATVIHANYDEMAQVLQRLEIPAVDGILLDLGVSSHQLDTEERGFSYHTDAPLDMRMSQSGMSAADVVNTWSQEELTRILFAYGEESFARAIARNICQARQEQPITTTLQLAEIVKSSVPQRVRRAKNPCKQTFQAIRIEVNRELEVLENSLGDMIDLLNDGGRICVITFHSLEDRIVKNKFRECENPCTCPKEFPVCVCGKKSKGKVITRKPVIPSQEELEDNSRAKSSKLRVFEREIQ